MSIVKVVATTDIEPGQAVHYQDGLVRRAWVGADRSSGHATNHINKGEVALYNTVTGELKRAPQQLKVR